MIPILPSTDQPLILEVLLSDKKIDTKSLEKVIREQGQKNCSLEEALINTQATAPEIIAKTYADLLGVPLITAVSEPMLKKEGLKDCLSEKFAREKHVLPLSRQDNVLQIAFLDPMDMGLTHELQIQTGLTVSVCVAPLPIINQGIDILYGVLDRAKQMAQEAAAQQAETEIQSTKPEEEEEDVLDLDRVIPDTKDTKVIRLVNQIMLNALREKCSDVHMEPFPKECKIRYRIDGTLNEMPAPAVSLYVPIISRLKILCKMDIAEKRVPQDGAFTMKTGDNKVDIRVSTVPTVYGEKMVMRLLNKDAVPLDLFKLGFTERQQQDFLTAAKAPHGLLFVTGPTGSGKSTTLYATLNLVMSPRKNILTVEDPVEYKFTGINQIQVKPQVELTFARALRAFLRQDPDVIMVGEVRDAETAQISLRAALTGHFVLSTLHTNSALSATSRLIDMGLEPFMLASTLRLVEAQRLIRRLCPDCKEPFNPDQEMIDKYGVKPDDTLYRPKGCAKCRDVGYKGRVGVFEVIRIIPELRDMIQSQAPLPEMEEVARKDGMQTLVDNGIVKAQEGLTSLEEVITVTSGE